MQEQIGGTPGRIKEEAGKLEFNGDAPGSSQGVVKDSNPILQAQLPRAPPATTMKSGWSHLEGAGPSNQASPGEDAEA